MRTEKGGERLFYHILAALLFASLCGWSAAALWFRIPAARTPVPVSEPEPVLSGGRLRGLLIRREKTVGAGAFPDAEDGARLSAGETGDGSALYFIGCDGWEALSPDGLDALTPEQLEKLLAAGAPENDGQTGRLVYGFTLLLAALFDGDEPPLPGPVRLLLDDLGELPARLLSVTTDALGRQMLVFRLTEFPEELYRTRVVEGEIIQN